MLGSSRKLAGAAEHLIDGSEKRMSVGVRVLLKVPVVNVVTQRVVAHSPGTHQHLDEYVAISPQPFQLSWLKEFSDWFEMEI